MLKNYLFIILGLLLFSTPLKLNAQTIYIQEDFNSGSLPTGWTNTAISGTNLWQFGIDGSLEPGNNNIDSTNFAYFDDDALGLVGTNNTVQLTSPSFNNSSDPTTLLTFDFNFKAAPLISDSFIVDVFDGIKWNRVFSLVNDSCGSYTQAPCTTNGFPNITLDISAYADSICQIRFTYHDGDDWSFHIGLDNISIYSPFQRFLYTPIEGIYGSDYTIVNYVDRKFNGYQDAYCGTKSYDGHEGTDFTLRSFRQMDSGIYVLAADTGIVTFVQDSLFDREKVSDTSKGLGNYIAIKHPNGFYSYYGHLKKFSPLVNVGDTVSAQERIAEVGSSGNSTDPHLHFELWYDSLYVVDPFNGDCGNDSTLWINPLPYDTNSTVWESGLYLKNVGIDNLRERDTTSICCPYELTNQGDTLSYWAHLLGLRNGDTLTIDWLDSAKNNQFSYDFVMQQDWWYYYYWSYITTQNISLGDWQVLLSRNSEVIDSLNFEVKTNPITQLKEISIKTTTCEPIASLGKEELNLLDRRNQLEVFNLKGQRIQSPSKFLGTKPEPSRASIYIVRIISAEQECTYKVLR